MGETAGKIPDTCQGEWKRNACAVSERDGEAARAITVLDVLDGVTLAVAVCIRGKGKDGEQGARFVVTTVEDAARGVHVVSRMEATTLTTVADAVDVRVAVEESDSVPDADTVDVAVAVIVTLPVAVCVTVAVALAVAAGVALGVADTVLVLLAV